MRRIGEFCALIDDLLSKINRFSKIKRANSSLAFSSVVTLPKSAQWPVSLMCSLMAEGDVSIDILAIQQKSLDRALFLNIFIREIRPSDGRASITIVHI